ncbi:MAG: 30S ribosomal protein S4 [Candidatus Taylorbacteria bacterium RIFCSPLOWO2_12_FULL_47_20]|uniref:Small ribosomal subunit protein uS4 n=2 Tax=Candidatus Tayloriibacteriota TaxID=1817919 RepID=A0A1G2PC94_9BACT|nr:MAG: 30S ribosomal protein S4 [Candidatus Taylorbacteria bacterium RIFCSPLOWO2_02_FULL_46_40]OHA45329.1 MAG: 30S ribosomal protein S4 [Candidatus Taylorbacteria bacterium RIFCSPLOWO2_12_FULL_47_20]
MKIGPRYKIARRLGQNLFEKTQTQKFSLRAARKAKVGKSRKSFGASDFGKQLMEKQRVRLAYGIPDRQFKRYAAVVVASKGKVQDEFLHKMLESRLDNVVYRLGLAKGRRAARQMVSHGHILINSKRVTIPSFEVKKDDIVSVRENSKKSPLFQKIFEESEEKAVPKWLSMDTKSLSAKVVSEPRGEGRDRMFDLAAVLEFYKR